MEANWAERIGAFFSSPSKFLSCSSPEGFLAELLRELRDDRASYNLKVLLLSPLCQYPELLCPSLSTGEETALELTSVFAQCPAKSLEFRCHLLAALTSVLVCSGCAGARSRASHDFLALLTGLAGGDPQDVPLRATACDCLRELEACCPGALSQHLELLSGLRQLATSRLHQAFTSLHALALRNAVLLLARRREHGGGPGELKALLAGDAPTAWETAPDLDAGTLAEKERPLLPAFTLGGMGRVPTLRPGSDCRELRSLLSALLEESYLLSPLSQAALLHMLVEVVAMVPGVSPTIFKAQLLRLLGTSKVCLLHTTLLMKAAFTDSLFSAEDEAFLLRRLVGLCQHPLLSAHEKLFHVHCLLHFPENRPVADDDSPPVLLTPRLSAALAPTVFDDTAGMLARFHLAALVHLEAGVEAGVEAGEEAREEAGVEAGEGARGLAYLQSHLGLLRCLAENGGSREKVVTFFRAAFLFLLHFHRVAPHAHALVADLCGLYRQHPRLAPHLLNLADRTRATLSEPCWATGLLEALQRTVAETAVTPRPWPSDLRRHLAVLARVAEEGEISQTPTLGFLSRLLAAKGDGDEDGEWRLGNGVLGVCRRLLVHSALDALFGPLADVLQRLSVGWRDTDVQDRARLYYALLTTLSRDKLAGVLGGDGQARRCALLPLVAAEESQQLVDMLTVRHAAGPLLELRRFGGLEDRGPGKGSEPGTGAGAPQSSQGHLEAYRAQLCRPDFCPDIVLRYQLVHADHRDPPDLRFQQLFNLVLHFQRTDEHYEAVGDVSVLRAFRDAVPPVVAVRLTPRQPYPTTLRAAATFATADGATWRTPLPDVCVAFEQTFVPAPAPLGHRLELFWELWAEIEAAEGTGADGAVSLFCGEAPGEPMLGAWAHRHFAPYLVEDPGHADEKKTLVFLPPRAHILLKISSEEDALQVHIATDTWQLLPHLNSFLLAITDTVDR